MWQLLWRSGISGSRAGSGLFIGNRVAQYLKLLFQMV